MRIRELSKEKYEILTEEGYVGVNSLMIVPERRDLSGFSSRIFKIEPNGHTSMHSHEREHLVMVLKGVCEVEYEGDKKEVGEGDAICIESGAPHRFSNPKDQTLVLLIMNFLK